jgi:hypothetical protein
MQACSSMQVREVDHVHTAAISQRNDVTIPSLHRRRQVIKVVLNAINIVIRNRTLIDLSEISPPEWSGQYRE